MKHTPLSAKSPVFTHVNTTIQGITTIRASKVQALMENEFHHYQNIHTQALYTFMSCTRTFAFWIDFMASLYVITVTYSFVLVGKGLYLLQTSSVAFISPIV